MCRMVEKVSRRAENPGRLGWVVGVGDGVGARKGSCRKRVVVGDQSTVGVAPRFGWSEVST